ncbi:S-formylglutathione hydrolase [Sulfuriflexus mobilis]|uniref:S-formylglutathione hydrolase n=1 Tax=Sulfuriflexus mobilis TaxID=1811807 RepID=UPI000F849B6B|nr:S-formylglutathione hydrolase [Sulfuriflexus mobilis]
MQRIESVKEFGGYLNRYIHESEVCHCEMTFSVYLPPQAETDNVPALYWLSGLTCTDENARIKAGAQRYAAEQGIALIFPDTSPRGDEVADDEQRYDLGKGAGFYVNATQAPWARHYHMYDYVTKELPALLELNLPLIPNVKSISGHSMGGHGALICALKNPASYKSVSAFSPICNPVNGAWGKGCFTAYLGDDTNTWKAYDATVLVEMGARVSDILIDQGTADEFYHEKQLLPENFQAVCEKAGQAVTIRMQDGYDHSYHFIATFIGEHIAYHAKALAVWRLVG